MQLVMLIVYLKKNIYFINFLNIVLYYIIYMSDISEGLQTYSTIKSYFSIIISSILLLVVTYFYFKFSSINYVKTDGTINYKKIINNNYVDCDNSNPEYDCATYISYNVDNKDIVAPFILDSKNTYVLPIKTNVFYDADNQNSYSTGIISPKTFILIICSINYNNFSHIYL